MNLVMKTDIKEYPLFSRGKVRDIYDLGDKLLIITTDRISAFDYILPSGIIGKGIVLNQLSTFWFNFTKNIIDNHLITSDVDKYADDLQKYRHLLEGRSMIVKKAKRIDIECVVRGYLAGSAWKEYKKNGTVCGIKLQTGLQNSSKLPEPIFTPAAKADTGHDENISFEKMQKLIGIKLANQLRDISLKIYTTCSEYALERGIIIADTKFEFGILDDKIILIDEVLTPDSSRFWDKKNYEAGKSQPSFDKQIVRDYLETTEWDKNSEPPKLPNEIISQTIKKYEEVLKILTQ